MLQNSPMTSMNSRHASLTTARATRVVVVAYKMFAESVALRLIAEGDMEIVGCAYTAATGVREAERARADVAIVDYCLPDGDGISVATGISAASPNTRALVLAARRDARMVVEAVAAGCSGFLTTDADTAELVFAIRQLAAAEAYVPSDLLPHLVRQTNSRALGADLSQREREVLELLATGASTQDIASQLYVSVTTVRNHVQRILLKLSAHSKLEAVAIAYREGVITQPH